MMMASIRFMSLNVSNALTMILRSCLTSASVTDFAMQPNTTSPLGCKAGLYLKAKLLASAVHCGSHLHSGTLGVHVSMISSRASVMSARAHKDRRSLEEVFGK